MDERAARMDDPHIQLEEMECRRLEVYAAPSTPAWGWPTLGVAVGLFLASFQFHSVVVHIAGAVAYALFIGIWVGTLARRSGVQPRLRGMPKPLRKELWRFWVAGAILAGVAVAIGLAGSFVLAGVVAGLVTAVGGRTYDRTFRRQAASLLAAARS